MEIEDSRLSESSHGEEKQYDEINSNSNIQQQMLATNQNSCSMPRIDPEYDEEINLADKYMSLTSNNTMRRIELNWGKPWNE